MSFFSFKISPLTKMGRVWCGENCDEPPSIIPYEEGDGDFTASTSLEWFYAKRQRQNRQAIAAHAEDPEWRTSSCWMLKSAITQIIIEDKIHGPFPLCHFDLHYGNLLFDNDYNLAGVIDWRGAGTALLERLSVSPDFITFPGVTVEENQDIINFRTGVREALQVLEAQSTPTAASASSGTGFSVVLGTTRGEIIHCCTYSFPHRALWDGRLVARLVFGDSVSRKQLVAVYGQCDLH